MITLLGNPDFEHVLVGESLSTGKAMERARAVTKLFALMGPPGSRVKAVAGDAMEELDADAVRSEARAHGLYDDEKARHAPWLPIYGDVIPYGQDARTGRDTKAVNSKAFSFALSSENGLEPGVFRHARLIRSDEELAAHQGVVEKWTLKPLWGFAGGGRLHGDARGLPPSSRERFHKILARDGAMLFEPWVERTRDLSAQVLVGESRTEVLMMGSLRNTEAGRYVGNGSLDAPVPALHEAAELVANALHKAGYRGVAGIDAFFFRDPVDGKEHLRPIVEINARFTLGLITGWMARMNGAARWSFETDWKSTLGTWRFGVDART